MPLIKLLNKSCTLSYLTQKIWLRAAAVVCLRPWEHLGDLQGEPEMAEEPQSCSRAHGKGERENRVVTEVTCGDQFVGTTRRFVQTRFVTTVPQLLLVSFCYFTTSEAVVTSATINWNESCCKCRQAYVMLLYYSILRYRDYCLSLKKGPSTGFFMLILLTTLTEYLWCLKKNVLININQFSKLQLSLIVRLRDKVNMSAQQQ